MHKALAVLVAGAVAGYVMFQMSQGKFDSADGKFLGLVEQDQNSYGLDDVARGVLIVGTVLLAGKAAGSVGIPAAKVTT